jgi:RNA polymerase sigma-70 factor (ECF subfamily)
MAYLLDEELVERVLAHDNEAFAELVRRYEKQVFSLAYRLSGDYDEAADLAQEAFLQIYRGLDKFDPTKKFFSWMYRVAHNTCLNVLQKKPKNQISLDGTETFLGAAPESESPENVYAGQELRAKIDLAIAELPDTYRDVIYLRYIGELSYQEIADRLELPVSTIETRLFRGRQLLQKALKEYSRKGAE